MMEVFRNMWRRKLRTSLTIFGIIIGVFALTVMGAMAEKMNLLMEGGIKYVTGQISAGSKSSSFGGGMLSSQKIEEMRKVKGVDKVQPGITMPLGEMGMIQLGMPSMIIGSDLSVDFKNRNYPELKLEEGSMITKKDRGKVTLGIDVANNKRVKVGEKMKIKGRDFVVKGIAEKTLTGPDKMVFMHIEDAQELFIKEDPFLRDLKKANPSAKELQNIYTDANVSWKDGVNADKLAKKIGKEVKDVRTLSPAKASRDFGQASVIFNLIILGSALIAVIVGGFSVINTMIMSISERTREIGIKKAVGAKTRHIIVEYLTEAALIGLIGGFVGLGLGILMVNGFNNQATAGNEIFLVTSRVASSAPIFATGLGVFAGLYPAIHAARLNPVEALRAD